MNQATNKQRQWGEESVKKCNLSGKQFEELCARVLDSGDTRRQAQKALDVSDFLCGAMSVFDALGIRCPVWPMQIMVGHDPIKAFLEEEKDTQKEYVWYEIFISDERLGTETVQAFDGKDALMKAIEYRDNLIKDHPSMNDCVMIDRWTRDPEGGENVQKDIE